MVKIIKNNIFFLLLSIMLSAVVFGSRKFVHFNVDLGFIKVYFIEIFLVILSGLTFIKFLKDKTIFNKIVYKKQFLLLGIIFIISLLKGFIFYDDISFVFRHASVFYYALFAIMLPIFIKDLRQMKFLFYIFCIFAALNFVFERGYGYFYSSIAFIIMSLEVLRINKSNKSVKWNLIYLLFSFLFFYFIFFLSDARSSWIGNFLFFFVFTALILFKLVEFKTKKLFIKFLVILLVFSGVSFILSKNKFVASIEESLTMVHFSDKFKKITSSVDLKSKEVIKTEVLDKRKAVPKSEVAKPEVQAEVEAISEPGQAKPEVPAEVEAISEPGQAKLEVPAEVEAISEPGQAKPEVKQKEVRFLGYTKEERVNILEFLKQQEKDLKGPNKELDWKKYLFDEKNKKYLNTYSHSSVANIYWRLYVWEWYFKEIFKKPILGYGFGKKYYPKFLEYNYSIHWEGIIPGVICGGNWLKDGWQDPHNSFIYMVFMIGFLGFFVYLWLLFSIFKDALKILRDSQNLVGIKIYVLTIVLSLVYMLSNAFFMPGLISPYFSVIFWVFIGLFFVVKNIYEDQVVGH